jgi:hypothetical protein
METVGLPGFPVPQPRPWGYVTDPVQLASLQGQIHIGLPGAVPSLDSFQAVRGVLGKWAHARRLTQAWQWYGDVFVVLQRFPVGTPAEPVVRVARDWVQQLGALPFVVRRARSALGGHALVHLELAPAPAISHAIASLRAAAREEGLTHFDAIPPEDWPLYAPIAHLPDASVEQILEIEDALAGARLDTNFTWVNEAAVVSYRNGREHVRRLEFRPG